MRLEGPGRTAVGAGEATLVPGRPVAVELARGDLLHLAADQLAALAAQAAGAPTGMVQLIEGDHVLLYGGYGLSERWAQLPLAPLSATL
ncbi:MAG TPA: histidine kinase, partial [Catenuloplanes sp.]